MKKYLLLIALFCGCASNVAPKAESLNDQINNNWRSLNGAWSGWVCSYTHDTTSLNVVFNYSDNTHDSRAYISFSNSAVDTSAYGLAGYNPWIGSLAGPGSVPAWQMEFGIGRDTLSGEITGLHGGWFRLVRK